MEAKDNDHSNVLNEGQATNNQMNDQENEADESSAAQAEDNKDETEDKSLNGEDQL